TMANGSDDGLFVSSQPVKRERGAFASTTLTHAIAVDLAHALVARVAAEVAARALLIEGQIASRVGLRPPRVSADVDVLVETSKLEDLRRALMARGWHPPVERAVPRVLEPHSVTLVHDEWPCAV